MTNDKKETFSDFDFADALEFLDLFPYRKWQPEIAPVPPSDLLKGNLKRNARSRPVPTNGNIACSWSLCFWKRWKITT
uniref:Uncharacterized protein n=1 Tax=Candidatus Kentrum sp. FW TaxID=2126338 RepID=A0A450SYB3_9GAMM|nr:MAG: hypothetical protein BECKFW1821B_GA0114236_10151 [Candidatus Kentron sp. FW]VFJ59109.1 MAG: hypothetical protein BECKFW1821A_GA0114235_108811 [Candidatus Kentron sp. FW]